MIDDLGALLLNGPIEVLLGLFLACLLVGFGYGLGRRSAFREVDEGRTEVLAACELAAAGLVAVPSQREGES